MRQIKFRAWDKKDKKWLGVNLHISIDGLLWWQFGYECEIIDKKDRDNIILMQYTGLKDKNGKDLFEGDIVKSEHNNNICVINFGEFHYDVTYNKRATNIGFSFDSETSFGRDIYGKTNRYEIIGNIYENPDLIEK